MPNGVQLSTGSYCQVGTFPIGIDPEQFVNGINNPPVAKRIKDLEQRFQGVKIIVGVDRLDYIKGVPQKMTALELFLEQHPEWIGKVPSSLLYYSMYLIIVDLIRSYSFNSPFPLDRTWKNTRICALLSTSWLEESTEDLEQSISCPFISCTNRYHSRNCAHSTPLAMSALSPVRVME
jgi:hypothetical protein